MLRLSKLSDYFRYCLFYIIEIYICIKSETCVGTLINKTNKLHFN